MTVKIPFMILLLFSVLFMQISVLPDTLNINIISRLVNLFILLTLFLLVFLSFRRKYPKKVYIFYFLPIYLIIIGYTINFVLALSPTALGQVAKLLPWLASIALPFYAAKHLERCWKFYYGFILVTVSISLIEYFAIFNGFLTPTIIETIRGSFLQGVISILHYIDGGVPYNRFYGVFAEPGTAAMFIIPALMYSMINNRHFSSLILSVAIFLTFSLGAYISLAISLVLFIFWKTKSAKNASIIRFIFLLVVLIAIALTYSDFKARYDKKQNSATVREENVTMFVSNFSNIVVKNPFGFILKGDSLSELESENDNYLGSNFSVFVAFAQGGIFSLIGYSIFFCTNVFACIVYFYRRQKQNDINLYVFLSLPSLLIYFIQRETILETMLYSILFAVPVIESLSNKKGNA